MDYKKTNAPINTVTRDMMDLCKDTGNVYETVCIIAKRANQIAAEMKHDLDKKLQEINSDYEAKRYKNITLQHLEIVKARKDLFNDWLKSKGKLGGQHKVPRLSNSRKHIDELLKMNG